MVGTVLFLTSRLPFPPDRGDRVRTYYLLKIFAEFYNVILVSLYERSEELIYRKDLDQFCSNVILIKHPKMLGFENIIKKAFSKIPFQVAYYSSAKLWHTLYCIHKSSKIDIVYTHLIRLAPYTVMFSNSYRIIDYTDCISMEYLRSLEHRKGLAKLFYSIETIRTSKYEQSIKGNFSEHWVISPVDFRALQLSADINSFVIPNPVAICGVEKDYNFKLRLVFIGNMSVPHNIVAAKFVSQIVMPSIISEFPKIEFMIIGANPIQDIMCLSGNNGTVVTGYVDDLYKELLNSDVFVAPMFFCAGIQNKVLEAMACGVPVITTPAVAESLGCSDGQELILAKDETSFIEKTLLLLSDESLRMRIGQNGKKKMLEKYSLASIRAVLNNRFSDIDNINKRNKDI